MDPMDSSNKVSNRVALSGLDELEGKESGNSNGAESNSLLPAPAAHVGGSTLMRAMLMVEENLFQQQKAANARREAADKAELEASKKGVESMREAAKDTMTQAVVSGTLQMLGAVAKGASVGLDIRAGVGANGQINPGADANWSKSLSVAADALDKSGGAFKLGWDSAIKEDDADKAQHDLEAKAANQRSQAYADFSREVHDLATRTLQKLDEILQARNQTALAVIRA